MRFDLIDLRLFLAVADTGSITHGAAKIGLSLAAASERLRAMEEEGRVSLLERRRHGVALTAAGEALVHHARLIGQQMAQMRGALSEHAIGVRATVRVLANTAAMTEVLPARIGPWLAANPSVDVDLEERQSVDIARTVTGGLADLGILSEAVDTGNLRLHRFATDTLVVIAAPQRRLAAPVRFTDLIGEDFVGLVDGALQGHVEGQAERLGKRLNVRIRVRTFEGIGQLVANGVGIGIVPQTAARRLRRSLHLSVAVLGEPWAIRRLVICHRADGLTNPARRLLEHLAATAA
ncbi:LysR family transcriptional regulator [Rhizobium sp. GN54]|uniref:LysR family transcriptional regulator n=1 Tax=Rhizobium sp. GN54 TaxID=2898150 RepID=UPI001E40803F|nr:LysR family transcriptional regulator [Rhizobium sp. GN54]MCD2181177.1 LysR family transcriptional regulator [Rhizobium sp. GN54]